MEATPRSLARTPDVGLYMSAETHRCHCMMAAVFQVSPTSARRAGSCWKAKPSPAPSGRRTLPHDQVRELRACMAKLIARRTDRRCAEHAYTVAVQVYKKSHSKLLRLQARYELFAVRLTGCRRSARQEAHDVRCAVSGRTKLHPQLWFHSR